MSDLAFDQKQHNLNVAIQFGWAESVEVAIEGGTDVSEIFKYNLPDTSLKIIKLLVDGGAVVTNKVVSDAIYKGKDRVLQYFVEKGAVITKSDVIYAYGKVSEKTLKALIDGVVDVTADENELIKYAYKSINRFGFDGIVEYLHTKGADIDLIIDVAKGEKKEQLIQFKKKWAIKKQKQLLNPKVIQPKTKKYKKISLLSEIPFDEKHTQLYKQFSAALRKYVANTKLAFRRWKVNQRYDITLRDEKEANFNSNYWIKDYKDDTYIISYGIGFSVKIILKHLLDTSTTNNHWGESFRLFKEKLFLLEEENMMSNDINEVVSERADIKPNNDPFKV